MYKLVANKVLERKDISRLLHLTVLLSTNILLQDVIAQYSDVLYLNIVLPFSDYIM